MVMLTYNASPLESEAGSRIASVLKAARGLCSKYRASPGFISRTQPFQEAKRGKKRKKKEREEGRKEEKRSSIAFVSSPKLSTSGQMCSSVSLGSVLVWRAQDCGVSPQHGAELYRMSH